MSCIVYDAGRMNFECGIVLTNQNASKVYLRSPSLLSPSSVSLSFILPYTPLCVDQFGGGVFIVSATVIMTSCIILSNYAGAVGRSPLLIYHFKYTFVHLSFSFTNIHFNFFFLLFHLAFFFSSANITKFLALYLSSQIVVVEDK